MLRIFEHDQARAGILRRRSSSLQFPKFGDELTPPEAVAQILASVRAGGDEAIRKWTLLFDKVDLEKFRISEARIDEAAASISPELADALVLAANRIRRFHEAQPLPGERRDMGIGWQIADSGGVLGQRVYPLGRVGVYVPGGSAPLPSSLLMSVIPAQVAGVREIAVCTPPDPHPAILAAARICGISEVYQVGGAQAIAAMAFGSESIRRVDKIVGAGNLFVTLAKQQVYGEVGLDGLAGPTETLIIADSGANPRWAAADLLAQAEHDPLASAILVTDSREFAARVQAEVAAAIESLSRADIIARSLAGQGGIVIVPDLMSAVEVANEYAPEHLCLSVRQPDELLPGISNAGGIFIGEHSFEVLGDYVAGPSHIMPTGGTARFASPLNVLDFIKVTSLIRLDAAAAAALSAPAAVIAQAETLTAHARAAGLRSGAVNS